MTKSVGQDITSSRRASRTGSRSGSHMPSPAPIRRPPNARSVGAFVPTLTRKAFEKYGFSAASLLTDWATIVGSEWATCTAPERLKWPQGVDAYGDVADDRAGRPGATLVLRVDGPRALEIEHRRRQILERINAYFGYRAVAEIRIIQAPLPMPAVPRPQFQTTTAPTIDPAVVAAAAGAALADIADERLRTALARLGDAVHSSAPKR